jgi:hypothetical protein
LVGNLEYRLVQAGPLGQVSICQVRDSQLKIQSRKTLFYISSFSFFFQVLFGLSSYANVKSVKKDLLRLLSGDDGQPTSDTIASSAYRLRTTVSFLCQLVGYGAIFLSLIKFFYARVAVKHYSVP